MSAKPDSDGSAAAPLSLPSSLSSRHATGTRDARLTRLRQGLQRGWRLWLPGITLVLFVGTAVGFVLLSQRYESNQLQSQQIADTLWVEQSIQFQLERDGEVLQILAREIEAGKILLDTFPAHARHLVRTRREMSRIVWYDAQGDRMAAVPDAPAIVSEDLRVTLKRVADSGQPFYSQPHLPSVDQPYEIDLAVPYRGGALVATFALDKLLAEMVPWWFAQTNEVQLVDPFGAVLASHASGGKGRGVYGHTTELDLPGTSLYLRTDSLRERPGLFPNIMVGLVVVLSLTLLGSLWALRRDVLRRIRVERQLREQQAFRQAMEDSLITGLRARDLEGRLTYVNPAFCRMVDFTPDELLGRAPPMPYWLPDAIEGHQRRFAQVLAGDAPRHGYEAEFQRKDGRRIQVLIHEAPLIDAQGRHTGWMSSVLDLTERRQMEELNRQQQEKLQSGARLATMGEIASTLSHELNQPLSAITSYAAGCLNMIQGDRPRTPDFNSELQDAIGKIQAQSQRAGMIIRSVHDLLKKREPARSSCELGALIRSTLPLIELQARKSATAIELSLPEAEITVHADRIMLEQVLLNLTRNAIEAMQHVPLNRRRITIGARIVDGCAEVSVADRGPGVPPGAREQLFAPFYSTKDEGMGMGLSICRSAVEFHGGRIDYADNPAGGALFRFTLPLPQTLAGHSNHSNHPGLPDDAALGAAKDAT